VHPENRSLSFDLQDLDVQPSDVFVMETLVVETLKVCEAQVLEPHRGWIRHPRAIEVEEMDARLPATRALFRW
jgi:hypothetical protein